MLYDNIHGLPHDEYGVINFLPFAHDTETTRTVKRQLCEAIVGLLDRNGLMKSVTSESSSEPVANTTVDVKCTTCGQPIVQLSTRDGISMVVARQFISSVASLNPECESRHQVITMEDHRLYMESQFALEETVED